MALRKINSIKKIKIKRDKTSILASIALVVFIASIGVHFLFGSHAATPTPTTPAVPVCGTRQNSDITYDPSATAPTMTSGQASTTEISGQNGWFVFLAGSGSRPAEWYFEKNSSSQTTINIYNATNNALISSFYMPSTSDGHNSNDSGQFAVDNSGNVYYDTDEILTSGGSASAGNGLTHYLYKYTPPATSGSIGTFDWSTQVANSGAGNYGVYSYTDSSNNQFYIGVVTSNSSGVPNGSDLFNTSGTIVGTNSIYGNYVHQTAGGDILASTVGQFTNSTPTYNEADVYDSTGNTELFSMGTTGQPVSSNQSFGVASFKQLSSFEQLPDGDYVVGNGEVGLEFFGSSGGYLGTVYNANSLPTYPIDEVSYNTNMYYYNGNIYYSGGSNLDSISVTNADDIIDTPQGAPYELGIGAGLNTTATDNYFPSGTTPAVNLQFYSSWQKSAANYTGTYEVRNISQIMAGDTGTPESFSIPTSASSYSGGYATVPISLPPVSPGVYEVDAQLSQGGTSVGATCMVYTVGGANNTFNPSSIPSGNDTSEVYLANISGQKLYRSSYTLDNCFNTSDAPTTSTTLESACLPGGSIYEDVSAATTAATADGITFEMQLGTGTSWDQSALTGSGVLQHLAELMMSNFTDVKYWEAWNEPDNNSFGPSQTAASSYVPEALEPVWEAKQAVEPSDMVVGISNDDYSVSNYQSYVKAGALNYLNVIALHSYTGWNQSYEEQGNVIPSIYNTAGETGQLQALQTYLTGAGYSGPLFDTESGFYENDGNQGSADPWDYYTQGDKMVRKMILEQSIGMDWLSNYYNEGAYPINQYGYGGLFNDGLFDNALSPGALATLNYEDTLGGRTFLAWLPTGIPHTYAAEYGTSTSDPNNDIVAVWSDDYSVGAVPTLSTNGAMTVTSEYGATSTVNSNSPITLTGQVQYITVPKAASLNIKPQESYSTNYALLSNGASASSSSNYACKTSTVVPNVVLYGIDDSEGSNSACGGRDGTMWSGSLSDSNPTLTVTLKQAENIDRIFVSSPGLGSSQVSLRDYTVNVDPSCSGGTFVLGAQVNNQFFDRNNLISIPAQSVCQIQITNFALNDTGSSGGLPPVWWGCCSGGRLTSPVEDVEVYGTGSGSTSSPTVSITSPSSGASLSGTTSLTATAAESGGTISNVQFKLDGTNIGSPDTSSPYSYSWNTTTVANGSHTLTAVATDSTGNTTTSSPVTVTVNNSTSTGTLSTPTGLAVVNNTTTFPTFNSIPFTWTASTDSGGPGVAGYYIFCNGTKYTVTGGSTTTFTVSGLNSNTSYSCQVQAYDSGSPSQTSSDSTAITAFTPLIGDLDNNGTVSGHDLNILLANFGKAYLPAEFDGGPTVAGHDMNELLANWGKAGLNG